MKKILFLTTLLTLSIAAVQAADPEPEESTSINLWIPGLFVKWVAGIADDHLKGEEAAALELVQHLGSMTVCVREGAAYTAGTDKKIARKLDRLDRREYTELLTVRTDEEQVNIAVRINKREKIKGLALLVDEKENTLVYVHLRCRISAQELTHIIDKMGQL